MTSSGFSVIYAKQKNHRFPKIARALFNKTFLCAVRPWWKRSHCQYNARGV